MFCNKCGKQIEDGSKFCMYCGQTQGIQEYNAQIGMNHGLNVSKQKSGIVFGMSVIELIISGLYIIVGIWWLKACLSSLRGTWHTFSFVENDVKFLGIVLYLIPCIFVLMMCVIGVLGIRNKKYHISIGIIIAVAALIMKIGSFIFDKALVGSFKMIFSEVFLTYGGIGISTITMSIFLSILVYAKNGNNR